MWQVIEHHYYGEALRKAFNAAVAADPGDCVLITGPTGVGKSTILSAVLDMLVGTPATWPEGELRYISIECDRESPGAITRNIAVDLNRALGNPFVSLPLPDVSGSGSLGRVRVSLNEHDLRGSSRALAFLKNTRYFGVDAMENIAPRREISAEARFDSVKSLVRPPKRHEHPHEVVLVMAGHYSLLSFWRANAQLARRVAEVPVFPYRETGADINRFEELLHDVTEFYPLRSGRSLRDWNDVVFKLSCGCIGMLKKLLGDAMIEMRCRGGTFLELKDVIAAAPPILKLEQVRRDLDGFFRFFETSATTDVVGDALARERHKGESGDVDGKRGEERKKRVVGKRKLGRRDQVGGVP
jgi:energy-coupling factor transporter ATP-binding protein EcfA2